MPAARSTLREPPVLRAVSDKDGYAPSGDIVMLSDPSGVAAESIRGLRTRIQAEHLQLGRRALAVCGPSMGVGCTFVAVNLAVALSQIGVKTLLVDANLRTPSVHTYFGVDNSPEGLGPCLADAQMNLDECVRPEVLPDLDLLLSGGARSGAQELLAGSRFPELMNACFRDYHMTIVDTAPANAYADCLSVANGVGFALIVARKHKSLLADIRTLSHQITSKRARVIGTVLNSY